VLLTVKVYLPAKVSAGGLFELVLPASFCVLCCGLSPTMCYHDVQRAVGFVQLFLSEMPAFSGSCEVTLSGGWGCFRKPEVRLLVLSAEVQKHPQLAFQAAGATLFAYHAGGLGMLS
jgi:hypothetical protein